MPIAENIGYDATGKDDSRLLSTQEWDKAGKKYKEEHREHDLFETKVIKRLDENAKRKLKNKNLDLIVSNNPKVKGAGFGTDTNIITLTDSHSSERFPLMSKYDAGNIILDKYLKMK